MAGQHEEIPCPFCGKGRIACLYFPSSYSVKRMHIASSSKPVSHKNPDIWLSPN